MSCSYRSGREPLARVRQHFLERPEHQRERCTKLVADVAEECRLGAIDLGQRFRALAFPLVCARTGQPDGDLFRDAADEVTVGIVERAARMDAEHQEPGRFTGVAQPDRQDRRCPGRGRPARNRDPRYAIAKRPPAGNPPPARR